MLNRFIHVVYKSNLASSNEMLYDSTTILSYKRTFCFGMSNKKKSVWNVYFDVRLICKEMLFGAATNSIEPFISGGAGIFKRWFINSK